LSTYICADRTTFCLGTYLDATAEDRRPSEQIAILERVSANSDTFWSDARRRQAVVRLQDQANHIEEAVEGCQRL
jgi:hypothetical protein